MTLKKHIRNTDVAALFLSLERVEDDGATYKVLWFNIVNKHKNPLLIAADEIKVTNLSEWEDL